MEEFLHSVIAMLLFIAALWVCVVGGKTVMRTVELRETEYQDEVLYEKGNSTIAYCISGDALLGKLLQGSMLDIQICCLDGSETVFAAGMNATDVIEQMGFPLDSEYQLKYDYDNDGRKRILRFVELVKDENAWKASDAISQ